MPNYLPLVHLCTCKLVEVGNNIFEFFNSTDKCNKCNQSINYEIHKIIYNYQVKSYLLHT